MAWSEYEYCLMILNLLKSVNGFYRVGTRHSSTPEIPQYGNEGRFIAKGGWRKDYKENSKKFNTFNRRRIYRGQVDFLFPKLVVKLFIVINIFICQPGWRSSTLENIKLLSDILGMIFISINLFWGTWVICDVILWYY